MLGNITTNVAKWGNRSVPLDVTRRSVFWVDTSRGSYGPSGVYTEECLNEIADRVICTIGSSDWFILHELEDVHAEIAKIEAESKTDPTPHPSRYTKDLSLFDFPNHTLPFVDRSFWIYWAILSDVLHYEILYRMNFFSRDHKSLASLREAEKRADSIGRRLRVRRGLWPFVEQEFRPLRVRRTRPVPSATTIRKEFPRKSRESLEDDL